MTITKLKEDKELICNQHRLCKECPLNNQLSPYTFERVCEMIDKLKEEKENE